jgi:hypothetical protein
VSLTNEEQQEQDSLSKVKLAVDTVFSAQVEKVMEAVMILRGNEPTWAESKKQLGTLYFILL